MVLFRVLADEMWDPETAERTVKDENGAEKVITVITRPAIRLVSKLIRFVAKSKRMEDPPTMRTWRKWEGQPGFLEWWQQDFPEIGEVTLVDLMVMDAAHRQAIYQGMLAGNPKHIAEWTKIRQLIINTGVGTDPEMEAWFAGGEMNGWKQTPAEA